MKLQAVAGLICAVAASCVTLPPRPEAGPPASQEVYVWQNAASPALDEAVAWARPRFERLNYLWFVMRFDGRSPHRASAETGELWRRSPAPFALSVRVGAFGDFAAKGSELATFASSLCAEAKAVAAEAPQFRELQLDFDAQAGQLGPYLVFLRQVKTCLGPTPLTITALGSWLEAPEFPELARSFPDFVLQLHFLSRYDDGFSIYKSAAARRYVAAADALGVPFRVALPTYSYYVDVKGEDDGPVYVEGEGYSKALESFYERRWVHADFAQLTADAAHFRQTARNLRGLIWFRLPLATDENAVTQTGLDRLRLGLPLKDPGLAVTAVARGPGLYDLEVKNDGDIAAKFPREIRVSAPGGRILTWEVLPPCGQRRAAANGTLALACGGYDDRLITLPPGRTVPLGWVRFAAATEVKLETEL